MSGVRAGRVAKRSRRRANRRPVLRMMAIMEDNNEEELPKQFLNTGRTGRRNALPNVLTPADAAATTADLPARLSQLATDDLENPQPGPSNQDGQKKSEDEKKEAGS